MNRSDALAPSGLGRPFRLRLTTALLLAASVAAVAAPAVGGRLINALSASHSGTSLPGAHFSDAPTDEEFLRLGLFVQPLVPVGPTTPEENAELAALLVPYSHAVLRDEIDSVQPLADFVARHPHSAWTPGLELNLGAVYRRTGHFSKALATWQSAWTASKDLTTVDGRAVGDMAAAYLSQFEAYLGRKETLAPLLEELKKRPSRGTAAELISESSRGMAEMESRPDVAFKCGPSALSRILRYNPTHDVPASRRVLSEAQSTPNGLSLSAVQAISVDEAGMSYQMAYRSPGAQVVTPAVAHWKMGHYAAVLGRDVRGRLLVGDATFGEDIAVTSATFDEEASGYFLVPDGPLPDGWRHVDAEEGGTVWGRGDTGGNHDNGATGRAEKQAFDNCKGGGCTSWNVEASVVGLELRDDPVGYTPPFGPKIRFPMTYSQRDVQQPMKFTYTNFGNKWTFDWLSYVEDDTNAFSGGVVVGITVPGGINISSPPTRVVADLYRRGGGDEPYIFPAAETDAGTPPPKLTSAEGQFSQAYLTRYADTNGTATYFTRTLPDGSVEKFTLMRGATGAFSGPKYFMTEVDDPQGNAVTIVYDYGAPTATSLTRITSVVDAAGQKTTLCYSDSPAPCVKPAASVQPLTNLQVTQIIDPFGRTASFGYDPPTGHLTSITDVLGIQSSYHYMAQVTDAGSYPTDFIDELTTPYGTTTFAYTDSTNLSALDTSRSVTITENAPGTPTRTSYVKFVQGIGTECVKLPDNSYAMPNGIQCTDANLLARSPPKTIFNDYLQYRNTFIWNPEQYAASVGTSAPYLEAKTIHWLHTDNSDENTLTAGRVPESIKEPLENRVWFLYPSQNVNEFASQTPSTMVGATNQPTDIIQAVGDGTYKHWQYQYDNYGHVTQSIDPVGRTIVSAYDQTNNVDLLTVTNVTPTTPTATNDHLLTLSKYVQHRPQQVTGANGQTTQLQYNASGQLTSSTDALNNTWTYTYVPAAGGSLTKVVGPAVTPSQSGAQQIPTYSFAYDPVGRLWTEEGPEGETLTFSYDAADRLTDTVFPDHTTEVRGYTLLDLTSFTDRMGNKTSRQYDGFRELIQINELGADSNADAGVIADAGANAPRTTVLTYWPDGTLKTVTDPLEHVTTYARDMEGRVQTLTYPDSSTEWSAYDTVGRLLSKSPDQSATQPNTVLYAYNLDDTLSKASLDSRAPTAFTYDPAYPRLRGWSRIVGGTWAQPTCTTASCVPLDQESYTYYPVGVLGATKLDQNVMIANPLQTAAGTTVKLSYGYDALDRVTSKSLNTGIGVADTASEEFVFDALGRLIYDTNRLGTFTYTYKDATPRVTGRSSANGPQVAALYFPAAQDGLLQQLSYTTPSGSPLAQYSYGYDARHNVTSFNDSNAGLASYTYDDYSQLTAGTSSQFSSTFSAAYDLAGNISSLETQAPSSGPRSPATSATQTFSYDLANTVTQANKSSTGLFSSHSSSTISWTPVPATNSMPSLETISSPAQVYGYGSAHRLTSISNPTTGAASAFMYDGLGRLSEIKDTATGAHHSYVWCGQKMCMELDDTAGAEPDALYVAQGTVINPTTIPSPQSFAYDITDLLGSERAVVTNNAIAALYTYDTFGNRGLLSGNAAASNRGFTGLFYHAASGLQFARDRAYNASMGRWMSRDPIGIGHAFSDPARFNATDLNLYAYVANNPQSAVDPTGDCPWCLAALTGGIVNAGLVWSTGGTGTQIGAAFLGGAVGGGLSLISPAIGAVAGTFVESAINGDDVDPGNLITSALVAEGVGRLFQRFVPEDASNWGAAFFGAATGVGVDVGGNQIVKNFADTGCAVKK